MIWGIVAFFVFYYVISKPMLKFTFGQTIIAFFVLYILWRKFGAKIMKPSAFGRIFG